MDAEGFTEPEVGVAVAALAILGAPPVRRLLRRAFVLVAAGVVWLWRGAAPFALKAAALCIAAILATPYSLDYDMMVLAPAIAFLAVDGLVRGFSRKYRQRGTVPLSGGCRMWSSGELVGGRMGTATND